MSFVSAYLPFGKNNMINNSSYSWYKIASDLPLISAEIMDGGTSGVRLREIYYGDIKRRPILFREDYAFNFFSHQNCPSDVLKDAISLWAANAEKKEMCCGAIEAILGNVNTPADSLAEAYYILKRKEQKSRDKRIKTPEIDSFIERALQKVLSNPVCPEQILSAAFVAPENEKYKYIIFENPNTPEDIKQKLMQDSSPQNIADDQVRKEEY